MPDDQGAAVTPAAKHAAKPGLPDFAVQVKGLDKRYAAKGKGEEKHALVAVDLEIPRGALFGLLGPNGAGKSTLINILAGLVNKTSGSASIWGYDITREPRQSRAAIGVVPQELNIDPFFTPRELLELQAGLYGVPPKERRTDEILRALGLADKAQAYARTLSGGMRRRLMVTFTILSFYWIFVVYLNSWDVLPLLMALLIVSGVGVILWRFRNKPMLYAGSSVLLLITLATTFGVVRSSPKTVASVVLDKWTESGGTGPAGGMTRHLVKVSCEDAQEGYLVANLWVSNYEALRIGEQVELIYHTESVPGVWGSRLVTDSINKRKVLSGGGRGFHGGYVDIFVALVTLAIGTFPLSYLGYQEYGQIKQRYKNRRRHRFRH